MIQAVPSSLTRGLRVAGLICFGIALGFIVVEGLLRLAGLPRPLIVKQQSGTAHFVFYRYDPMPAVLMYRMQPNAELIDTYCDNPRGYFEPDNTLHYQTNSAGFRGPDLVPGNGRVTVAFLGDSFTFGEGVRDQDTFVHRTADMLRRAGRGDVVARNYGMLGFNTLQERILLESEVLPQRPDAVVVGYFLNDASKTVFGIVNGEVVNQSDDPFWYGYQPSQGLFENLRIGQLLTRRSRQEEQTRLTTGYYQFLYSPRNPDYDSNLRSLREIVQLCEARQIPLVIAVLPVLYELQRYPFLPIHNQVRDIVREASKAPTTRFVDLLDSLAPHPAGDLWVHPTDHHPNEVAHAEIASALSQELKQLLPDRHE